MIVERCTALAAQFSAARRTYQLEERLGRIQEATDRVKALRQRAEKASEILTTLSSRATDPDARAVVEEALRIVEAHRELASLWKQLKSDENLLGRRDHEAYRKVFHATENACDKLRHAAERTWHYHANSCLQDDGPIVNVFEGTNPKTVADLRRLHSELLDLRRVASPSRAQIEEFDRKVAVYRAAFQSLGGDIPKDVRVALQAAASGGAPIHLFSSDVVAWLRERGVAGSFRVIAKSAP